MNKARITYRFGEPGREESYKEQRPVIPLTKEEFTIVEENRPTAADARRFEANRVDVPTDRTESFRPNLIDMQPLNQFTTDFGAWKSPFEAETERVERVIRETSNARPPEPVLEKERYPVEQEEYYNGDTGYYEANRTNPRYEGERAAPTVVHSRYERNNRTPLLKIIASVTGAVGTGVLIGYFVLSMFGGENALQGGVNLPGLSGQPASTVPVQTKTPAPDSSTAKGNAAPTASTAAVTAPVNIAAQSYTLLQNGAYSSQQGADAAAAELRKKGLAAFVQPSDKYYVYAGVTASRDDALALSQLLKEQKLDLFLKAISLPAVSKIKWSGEQTATAEQYFTQNEKLVQTILNFSAARLKEKTPAAMDDATMRTITTAHQAWSGVSGTFAAGLGQEHKTAAQRLNTAMNTAVTSMNEYKKNASPAFLWEAQSSIMQLLFAQLELLEAVKAQ